MLLLQSAFDPDTKIATNKQNKIKITWVRKDRRMSGLHIRSYIRDAVSWIKKEKKKVLPFKQFSKRFLQAEFDRYCLCRFLCFCCVCACMCVMKESNKEYSMENNIEYKQNENPN